MRSLHRPSTTPTLLCVPRTGSHTKVVEGFLTGTPQDTIIVTCYNKPMPRGRPRSMHATTAAERMRAYRRRLRERGLVMRGQLVSDPLAAAVRFPPGTLLTPAEQDVLRRFCAGLGRLPVLPSQVSVFGSRARGGSTPQSDLDIAILVDTPKSPSFEQAMYSLAAQAQAPYQDGGVGIHLKPVALFSEDRHTGFFNTIRKEMVPVWTKPL